jgi:hypothetical protein
LEDNVSIMVEAVSDNDSLGNEALADGLNGH